MGAEMKAKKKKGKRDSGRKAKSKFQEYLELEMGNGGGVPRGAEEDMEIEGKLAKKLSVKKGKLGGPDDGMNFLIGGNITETESMFGEDDIIATDEEEVAEEDEGITEFNVSFDKKKYNEKQKDLMRDDAFADTLDSQVAEIDTSIGEDLGDLRTKASKNNKKRRRKKKKQCDNDISPDLQEGIATETGNGDTEDVGALSIEPAKKKHKRKKLNGDTSENQLQDKVTETEHHDGVKIEISNTTETCPLESSEIVRGKYVPPQLRACRNVELSEFSEARRLVKRLLNKLGESNVESTTQEVATVFRSLARSVACQIIAEEFLASALKMESLSPVFAAFVAGMACLVGLDFSAKLIAHLAKSFEDEYSKENGLSLKNLIKLLCNMYSFGVFSSDLIYDLLSVLTKHLTELDVSVMEIILDDFGMKLRSDDPTAMKECILNIRDRVNEFKSSLGTIDGMPKIESKRMAFMLERICDDIKNNKKRHKEEPGHDTRLKKWLQKLRVDDILLRGLKWSKLLDPEKKGQWWVSGEASSAVDYDVGDMTTIIGKEVTEAQKLVQLAAAQRMNTDLRRGIFCIIMSADDYVDAYEKLLRLDLAAKQDREIMRVLVECCLQEKVFNKYYTVLASRLCSHDKNNKFSLQYCIWDHFKELESMELNRSMNLARFVAEMLSNFSLSLANLKVVDLTSPANLTPKRIMHFKMLFEAIFENSDAVVWNIFSRAAALPELEMLRSSLVFFIKHYVVAANPNKLVAVKLKIAKKALDNVAGVLM